MRKSLQNSLIALLLLISNFAMAQGPEGVEMADVMHSNGKIYVVVAVVAIVFAVITVYLITIDRKLRKLEKEIEK